MLSIILAGIIGGVLSSDQCITCDRVEFIPTLIKQDPKSVTSVNNNSDSIKLQQLDYTVFNNLMDINDAVEIESDIETMMVRDKLFSSLSQILSRHGVNDIIGASILHNHFHVNPNEFIAVNSTEEVNTNIKFVIYPLAVEYEQHLVPYMFKFDVSETGVIRLYPLQYIVDNSGEIREKVDMVLNDDAVLLDIGEAILESGLIDYIGIFISYYDGNERLTELTFSEIRTQHFRSGQNSDGKNVIPTHYMFKDASCDTRYASCEFDCEDDTVCNAYCEYDWQRNHVGHRHDTIQGHRRIHLD